MRIAHVATRAATYLAAGRMDLLAYRWRMRHLDLGLVSVADLGLSPTVAHHYSDSGGPDLARVVRSLHLPPGGTAMDLGSGKGGAVLTLSGFHFNEVVGVELSASLIKIAERNCYGRPVRFICADAQRVTDLDRVVLLYLYNPFPYTVLKVVLENVRASLRRCPRDLALVYKHPACHDVVMASGLFPHWERMAFPCGGHPFHIYRHSATGR